MDEDQNNAPAEKPEETAETPAESPAETPLREGDESTAPAGGSEGDEENAE